MDIITTEKEIQFHPTTDIDLLMLGELKEKILQVPQAQGTVSETVFHSGPLERLGSNSIQYVSFPKQVFLNYLFG